MVDRRQWAPSDDAVSPVIGVILMVAITVVLAAVVFVLAGSFVDDDLAPPKITFLKNEEDATLTVFTVHWNGDPLMWNGTVTATAVTVSGCTELNGVAIVADTPIRAGDILGGCNGTMTLVHEGTGQLIYSASFQ